MMTSRRTRLLLAMAALIAAVLCSLWRTGSRVDQRFVGSWQRFNPANPIVQRLDLRPDGSAVLTTRTRGSVQPPTLLALNYQWSSASGQFVLEPAQFPVVGAAARVWRRLLGTDTRTMIVKAILPDRIDLQYVYGGARHELRRIDDAEWENLVSQ